MKNEDVINLFMDYETLGEHQPEDTGIFAFMRSLPEQVLATSAFEFLTPREVVAKHQPVAPLNVPFPISALFFQRIQMEATGMLSEKRTEISGSL